MLLNLWLGGPADSAQDYYYVLTTGIMKYAWCGNRERERVMSYNSQVSERLKCLINASRLSHSDKHQIEIQIILKIKS